MPFLEINTLPAKEIVPGYTARTVHTGNITLVYWTVSKGAGLGLHTHPHEQIAHVLSGVFELQVGDEIKTLEPGTVAVIPGHLPHGGRAITDCSLLDVFYPERDDYKFSEKE